MAKAAFSLKKILVTGAEGSLGHAVTRKFLSTGCDVFGTYHEKPADYADPKLSWIKMDVTRTESIRGGLQSIGEIDGMVHCAGGFRFANTDELTDQDLSFLLDTNLRSAFLLAREVVPMMKKRCFGRIVFVSARATLGPVSGMGAYAASKAGLNALTAALADEVRSFDINVNAILPSIIDTAANRKDMPKADPSKWVPAEDIAEIIFSLMQPWGKSIHGALIPVSGRV